MQVKVTVNVCETKFGFSLSKSRTINGINVNYISFDAQECGDSNPINIISKIAQRNFPRKFIAYSI